MVIAKLRGGLGNQLFIYAAARCLAQIHRVPLLLDTSWYRSGPRPLLLDRFNITADMTSRDCSGAADGIGYNQEQWCFYPEFLEYPGNRFLSGWWQSERFFAPAAGIIRAELTLRDPAVMDQARDWLASRQYGAPCIALHRRRLDYVQLAERGQFTLLADEYYQSAMSRFAAPATFLVFSDDLPWCRTHMSRSGIVFCDVQDTLLAFAIMQSCDHYIIANSTYSWWAAWLGEAPGKQVIAPAGADWFGPVLAGQYDTRDIIPDRWIQLPGAAT